MKKILFSFLGCFIYFSQIFSIIIETPNFDHISQYITPNTLVLLDIDDTLLIPTQTLGTDVWFLYRFEQYKSQGMPITYAFERALADWEAIRHLTQVKIVEEGTEKIIASLQDAGVSIMGLTTQGLALTTRTIQQLHSLNIDLSKTSPFIEDYYFMNPKSKSGFEGVLLRKGILFTSGTKKGEALLNLFTTFKIEPSAVLFINDKYTHLRDVEEAMENQQIPFIGLRYSYSDERVAKFNKDIADVQWMNSSFNRILSDNEAESLLFTNQKN